jgi:hypothetical protein
MTVINRRTFMAEHGKLDEALTLLQGVGTGIPYTYRIYQSHYGTFDTLAFELEFASVAEMEAFWDATSAGPETVDFLSRWYALTRPGGTNEVWILVARNS